MSPVADPPSNDDSTESDLMAIQDPSSTNQAPPHASNTIMPMGFEQQLQDAVQQQALKRKEMGALQQGGIDQLKQYQQDYSQMPIQTDYSQMGALIDSINQNSGKQTNFAKNFQEQAAKQETPEQRVAALSGMQKDVLNQQLGLSKEDLGGLKDQLDFYKTQQANQAMSLRDQLSQRNNDRLMAMLAQRQGNSDRSFGLQQDRVGAYTENMQNRKDQIAQNAGDHIDKDPLLIKIDKQSQQMDLDSHTLATAKTLTPQLINEVQQGIATAISGGSSAGLGKTEQIELQTAAQKLANIKQQITSNPTAVNDPALVSYLSDTIDRLRSAYQKNGYARAQKIFNGRSTGYRHNPDAIQVMKDKVEAWKPIEPLAQDDTPGVSKEDALAEAKKRGLIK